MIHKETSLSWIYEFVLLSIIIFNSESQYPLLSTHNIQHILLSLTLISFCSVSHKFSWEALEKDDSKSKKGQKFYVYSEHSHYLPRLSQNNKKNYLRTVKCDKTSITRNEHLSSVFLRCWLPAVICLQRNINSLTLVYLYNINSLASCISC